MAFLKPYSVLYSNGDQFLQLEELIASGSEPTTFRWQLTATSHGIRTRTTAERAELFKSETPSPLDHGGTPCRVNWFKGGGGTGVLRPFSTI